MQIPWGIVISPDGTKAYVGLNECYDDYYVTGSAGDDGASSEVGRLDLATGTWDPAKTGFPSQWNWDPGMFLVLRDSINNLEPFIHDIAISPAGDRVFVSTGKIPYLHNVKYVDAGNLNTGYNSLQIFYPDLDQYTGSVITMGGMDAWGLAATPDGASLLIGLQAGSATNTVSAYDPAEDLFGLVSVLGVTTLTNTGNITVPDAFDVGITFP
jgi:DNA-binding beta-propeller fold protein YncE